VLFNVESDSGDRIVGYCVPDDFSSAPTIRALAETERAMAWARANS
jgi:hypothetical protein